MLHFALTKGSRVIIQGELWFDPTIYSVKTSTMIN